jgi:hypothetical protein
MKPLFIIFAAIATTYAYYCYSNSEKSKYYYFKKVSFLGIFVIALIVFVAIFQHSIQPKEWDYTCFYLIGKVAHLGLNIYNPDHYYLALQKANMPFELSDGFKDEFMVTACLYPPPTVFLFLPLGYMTYMQGLYFFYALIFIAVVGCIYQLKTTFFEHTKWDGWIIVIIFLLLMQPLYSVIKLAQTLIFLLFFFILLYKNRGRRIAGLYLAISVFIKPFSIVLLFYFLIKKRWDIVISFLVATMAIIMITIAFFGTGPFYEYIFNNPSHRVPEVVLYEDINKSLFAVLCRVIGNVQYAKISYYVISSILVIISGIVLFYQNKNRKAYGLIFPLLLSSGLIIYPNTLDHYGTVQILSLLIILKYISSPRIVYIFLFLFYIVLLGGTFSLNIYLFLFTLLMIFEDQVKNFVYKQKLYHRLYISIPKQFLMK